MRDNLARRLAEERAADEALDALTAEQLAEERAEDARFARRLPWGRSNVWLWNRSPGSRGRYKKNPHGG